MTATRGDVVMVNFPFASGRGGKPRPAVVVQNDRDNGRLLNTVVAMITGVTRRSYEATQMLIEVASPDGKQSGLSFDSVVNCVNLFTLDQGLIRRRLGSLSPALLRQLDSCLKAALGL